MGARQLASSPGRQVARIKGHVTNLRGPRCIVQALRPVRSTATELNGPRLTLDPDKPPQAQELLAGLRRARHYAKWQSQGVVRIAHARHRI